MLWGEDAELCTECSVLQQHNISPGRRDLLLWSEGPPVKEGTISLQLSCQHSAGLRFNEEKKNHLHGKPLQQLNLHVKPICRVAEEQRDERSNCWIT